MDRALEFFAKRAGVFGGDPGDEHRLAERKKFGGDFDDLIRRLAGAKNDFGEVFPERAVRVHLCKAEVGHRRGLKGLQNFFPRDFSRAKLFQQLSRLASCHGVTMPHETPVVTRENPGRYPSFHDWQP